MRPISDNLPQAGPSRQPLEPTSPRRSTSLTSRQREKQPMSTLSPLNLYPSQTSLPYNPDRPTAPRTASGRYDYHMRPSSPNSIRRSTSDEGGQRSRSYTVPNDRHNPTPPPISPNEAALLQHVREKMRDQDQEAMRRLRMDMAAQAIKTPTKDPFSPTGDRFPHRKLTPIPVVVEETERRESDSGMEGSRTPRPFDGDGLDQDSAKMGMPFIIAVIGHPGVGKTTVIQRATKSWGVSEPITTILPSGQPMSVYKSHVEPGGKIREAHMVTYVELDISTLNTSAGSAGETWAEGVGSISGVILCYDATRVVTLEGVTSAMDRLTLDGTPMIILACKSDPEAELQVDAAYANSLGEAYNVGLIEVTSQTLEGKSKMRNGLRWLLFKLEQRIRKQARSTSHLNLNTQSTSPNGAEHIRPLPPDNSAHSPDLQSPTGSEDHSSSGGERLMWGPSRLSTRDGENMGHGKLRSSAGSLQWIMAPPDLSEVLDGQVEDEGQEVAAEGDSTVIVQEKDEEVKEDGHNGSDSKLDVIGTKEPESQSWLKLEDLYRKVFSYIVTKEGDPTVAAFFLTYRRFCKPLDLMREFQVRFDDVDAASLPKDLKMLVLQRLIGALIDWSCDYPGDVSSEAVQAIYREVLAATLRHRFLSHLSSELVTIEAELIDVDDIDGSWSLGSTYRLPKSASSRTDLVANPESPNKRYSAQRQRHMSLSSTALASASALSLTGSSISQDRKTTSFDLRRNGSNPRLLDMVPQQVGPANDFGFVRWSNAWNTLMRFDARAFAVDLTRLQWQRFEMIRPRDIFRHDLGKERDGSVAYSVEFFNHLSRWVTTMILANPKPKHRARTYERFSLITHHLRRLNNYDSLYAVISGMKETSIHRLAQTHTLVNTASGASRDFEANVRLMDPRGGYAEYTKALKSDIAQGSKAIPLLTVTLGLVSRLQSVRPVDIRDDGSIQWDKFVKFGQILSVISTCQQKGPMIPGEPSGAFQALVENTHVITSEDDLFERSRLLEPPNHRSLSRDQGAGDGGGGGRMKKLVSLALNGDHE